MPATYRDETTTTEQFSSNFKILVNKGYLEIAGVPKEKEKSAKQEDVEGTNEENSENSELSLDEDFANLLHNIKR